RAKPSPATAAFCPTTTPRSARCAGSAATRRAPSARSPTGATRRGSTPTCAACSAASFSAPIASPRSRARRPCGTSASPWCHRAVATTTTRRSWTSAPRGARPARRSAGTARCGPSARAIPTRAARRGDDVGALDGKVALVAGGGTGVGRATALLFAAEGARVAVFGRRPEPLAEGVGLIAGTGGRALAVRAGVAAEAEVDRLVATARGEWGGVDALVNSAAVRVRAPLTDISVADFAEVLRINLLGAFVLTKGVVPAMRARGGGAIVHIGSA